MIARAAWLLLSAAGFMAAAPALPQVAGGNAGSTGTITVGSGPHKGEYHFAPTETCFIASLSGKPPGLSVVMTSEQSSLSIDMPVLDDKHAHQIQVVLVIADSRGAKGTSSVTYEIDTRPDALLEPYQRAERANKGMSGKASTTLMQKGDSALLSFSGETASGVKLDGSITCRKVT